MGKIQLGEVLAALQLIWMFGGEMDVEEWLCEGGFPYELRLGLIQRELIDFRGNSVCLTSRGINYFERMNNVWRLVHQG